MNQNNLKTVLHNLKSDKITERREGLNSIREVFSRDKVVANFTLITERVSSAEPRAWLPVFQALFTAVFNEKLAVTKRSTSKSSSSNAAATKRLAEAASVVRWLTERTSHLMNKKVLKALLEHLTQTMVHQGELLAPVTLDYAKALKCLLSYTPHLDHIEDHTWVRIVEIAFNVILEDPIRTTFAEDEELEAVKEEVDSDMYVDDGETADDAQDHELPSAASIAKGKKRQRREPSATPIISPKTNKARVSKRRNVLLSVSLEQVEFTSLLSILISSPAAPILSAEFPNLASGILTRLQRFLERYPADSSLLHDYLIILYSTLQHISLNRKSEVERFARHTWDGLVGLWGMKDKRMKEGLVAVLRVLFHFLTAPNTTERAAIDCTESVSKLWTILDGEAESRWGVDGLSIEALRLELMDPSESKDGHQGAFTAKTFRAGSNFDAGQALSWAVLELQADCAAQLFQLSESMHPMATPGSLRYENKRTKLENPVNSLLHSIHAKSSANVRNYRLQILLFFIERHWLLVHDSLKQDIITALLRYVTCDDGIVQSWVFLNFAAIAFSEGLAIPHKISASNDVPPTLNASTWDPIWTHSIRRANVPIVCRAACHAGHSLLVSLHPHTASGLVLLTSHRVLVEIETLANDMDVQGPAYPVDSVCMFLSQCLAIASQDVRLYRMRLEDKVLTWLIDSWKIIGIGRTKVSLHAVKDIQLLLQTICGLAKQVNLTAHYLLPDTQIVNSLIEEGRTKIIRDYLLLAKLPAFQTKTDHRGPTGKGGNDANHCLGETSDIQLAAPQGRERRLSAFFSKSLDSLILEWETLKDSRPSAETARVSLDFAIAAIIFEFSLMFNGTSSNRQVLQNAAKMISMITPLLKQGYWTVPEKILVALPLELLTHHDGNTIDIDNFQEALLLPDGRAGIKQHVLKELLLDENLNKERRLASQIAFLRLLWQHSDVQSSLATMLGIAREILRDALGEVANSSQDPQRMEVDDSFGPIRTTNAEASTNTSQAIDRGRTMTRLFQICINVLSCGPFLQSASGEPTRDRELTELVLSSARAQPTRFILICPVLFQEIRHGTLDLPLIQFVGFLDLFSDLLQQYAFGRSETFHRLVVDLLDSNLPAWLTPDVQSIDVGEKVASLCTWLSGALRKQKFRTWALRNSLALFLARYLRMDPSQGSWPDSEAGVDLPTSLLPMMSADEDMRVRFRVAVLNGRLFAVAHHIQRSALEMYESMKDYYSVEIENYEHILTRMLALGNIMVVSSAVRRGSYWHLLETCVHSSSYSCHIETILQGVSERLGMPSLSVLFEAYASQLAYSILQAKNDFFRFPPHLLGYRDRKQCAEATFRAFTPTNVLTGGEKLFENHCRVLQKSTTDGLRDCFGDIVGFQIARWNDEYEDPANQAGLEPALKDLMGSLEDFDTILLQNLNDVVANILRALGDQDHAEAGPIVKALRAHDQTGKTASAFQALTRYRLLDSFDCHTPNLPAFPAATILRSLGWLGSLLPSSLAKATTYHVLQQLLADLKSTPLVNEQNRLVNALSLWMALRYQDFEDATLLHALLHGATLLFSQSDLARSAQSLLEWAIRQYRRAKLKDSRLTNILIRICCIAHDYANNSRDKSISEMGSQLLTWINDQVYAMSKASTFESIILRALTAWPHQPSLELIQFYDDISSNDLSSVLSDHRITSNKFRLVRRLRDHALEQRYSKSDYSKTDFWRLKECMPLVEKMQDEDADAFAALLVLSHGKIGNFNIEQANLNSLRPRHRRSVKKRGPFDVSAGARDAITLALLIMLEDDNGAHVYSAYNTLRLIVSVSSSDDPHQYPSEYRTELEYLKAYRRLPAVRDVPDLHELLKSDLYLDSTSNFPRWITMVTTLLSDALSAIDPIFAQLASILASDIAFAEQILPVLVHTLLQSEKNKQQPDNLIFRSILSDYFTSILSSKCTSKSCVRVIIDVILHLRYFAPFINEGHIKDALAYNTWLNIDFTLLAQSSIICGSYTTALLFLELASEFKQEAAVEDTQTEQVLYEIYAHIDEPDGFYGIKTKNLNQFLIKRFHHEKQWDKAFRFHGAALEAGNSRGGEGQGLLESFHFFGFDHLAIDTLQNSRGDITALKSATSMSYKLGWRTETWDLPDQTQNTASAPLYQSLRAIYRERDSRALDATIRNSLSKEMGRMRDMGTENVAEIRETAQDLMCLSQILQWRRDFVQKRLESRKVCVDDWLDFVNIDNGFGFSDLESLMATRISLIRSARQREERQRLGNIVSPFVRDLINIEKKSLLRLSEAARTSNQVQIALNSVVRAQCLEQEPSSEVSEEFANVLWVQKEEKLAVQFLQELVNRDKSSNDAVDVPRKAVRLARLGTWTSEACLEKPMDIWARFFDPSITLLETGVGNDEQSNRTRATVYRGCAMFAERQYHAVLKSPDAIRWKVYVDRKTKEIQHRSIELASTQQDSTRQRKLRSDQDRAQKLLNEDSELFRKHNIVRDTLLKQALEMHSRCLQVSDGFDNDSTIRFCSLWFANFDDPSVLETVQTALERIPSRKLVFLSHQLTARLAHPPSPELPKSQANLQRLILRMCQEHPFHSLYQVFCLKPPTDRVTSDNRRQSGRHSTPSTQTERGVAASTIFDRLLSDERSGSRVRDVELLCLACLEWAKFPIVKNPTYARTRSNNPLKIPEHLRIRKLSGLKVPVTTARTSVDPTMEYKDCVWIESYEPTFETAGGINLPKINICHGSDGQKYKQLFKGEGNDDLRQDAVMEQVFDLVNSVLDRDRETRKRELRVRDYKVIPLSPRAGLLEFVGNTSPLRDWLGSAHLKYHPSDHKSNDVTLIMKKAQEEFRDQQDKQLAAFLKIRERFRPVMRHYFTEKHKTPIAWFAMRLTYTRSVATTSIVGHVLGLGDRHVSNILMDNVSGEVVHIDLGIAFDQGKLLPVPERVPFRMTADMVDGMGNSGTSGVFQRCAEETLRVLREESEVIMTVLEVFKHDPLYSWTASEVKVKQAQSDAPASTTSNDVSRLNIGIGIDMSSGSADEAADRALSSVSRKLDKSLSVESTVNELIAEATDPMNLATIFHGWSPHL